MTFRARKLFETFEKGAPGHQIRNVKDKSECDGLFVKIHRPWLILFQEYIYTSRDVFRIDLIYLTTKA